jgi:hypothetical protein
MLISCDADDCQFLTSPGKVRAMMMAIFMVYFRSIWISFVFKLLAKSFSLSAPPP